MEWTGFIGTGWAGRGQALSEPRDWVLAIRLGASCIFCQCEFLTHLNCGVLVLSDSAEEDLLLAAIGIEIPFTVLGNQGNREGPVFSADIEDCASVRFADQTVHLLVFLAELFAFELVLLLVARGSDFLSGSENGLQSWFIPLLGSLKESVTRVGGRREGPWV